MNMGILCAVHLNTWLRVIRMSQFSLQFSLCEILSSLLKWFCQTRDSIHMWCWLLCSPMDVACSTLELYPFLFCLFLAASLSASLYKTCSVQLVFPEQLPSFFMFLLSHVLLVFRDEPDVQVERKLDFNIGCSPNLEYYGLFVGNSSTRGTPQNLHGEIANDHRSRSQYIDCGWLVKVCTWPACLDQSERALLWGCQSWLRESMPHTM